MNFYNILSSSKQLNNNTSFYDILFSRQLSSRVSQYIWYKIWGNTVQSSTPTPSTPIEVKGVGDGTKNLLPIAGIGDKTISGVNFIDNDNGTITVKGTATNRYSQLSIYIPDNIYGNVIVSGCPENGGTAKYDIYCWDSTTGGRPKDWQGSSSLSDFGSGAEISFVKGHDNRLVIRVYEDFGKDGLLFKPMIRKANTTADFEPHYEGYKIPIVSNVLEGYNTILNSQITGAGDWHKYDGVGKVSYIEAQPNTKYHFNLNINYQGLLRVYSNPTDNLPQLQQDVALTKIIREDSATSSKYTFTTPANCKQLVIQIVATNFDNILQNSIIYNDAEAKIIHLNEPLHEINNDADILSYSDHNITRKIKKLILTGNEAAYIANGVFYLTSVTDYKKGFNINISKCSHFSTNNSISASSSAQEGISFYGATGNVYRLYIKNSSFTTLQQYKDFFAEQYANGTPVTIWYVLEEAETEQIHAPDILADTYTSITVDTEIQPSQVDFSTKGKHVPQPSLATVRKINAENNSKTNDEEIKSIEETKEELEEPIEKEQTKEVEPIEKDTEISKK